MELRDGLRRCRVRIRSILLCRSLAWSALAAACALALLRVTMLLSGHAVSPAMGGGAVAFIVIAGFAAALVAAPGEASVARLADRRLGLGERLGTAIELRGAAVAGPVARALLRQAAGHARQIPLARLAPLPWREWTAGGAAACIVLAIAAAIPAPRELPSRPANIAEAAETLERVAALVEHDAEERQNPYLAAVARSLHDLARAIADNRLPPRSLDAALEPLLEHAVQAYGESPPSWLGPRSSRSAPLRQQLREAATNGMPAAPETAAANVQRGADASPLGAGRSADIQVGANGRRSPQQTGQFGDAGGVAVDPGEGTSESLADYALSPADQARLDRERQIAEQQRQQTAGAGQPIGGARDAGRGGDLAGEGARPLGDGGEPVRPVPAERESLPLDAAAQAGGRTIRIEALPDVARREVVGSAGEHAPWTQVHAVKQVHDAVPAARREIGRRYFLLKTAPDRP